MAQPIHHAVSYIEFGVTDLAAARRFYETAFGWEFNDYGPDYSGIRAPDGDGEIGGLNPRSAANGGGPLVLLYSDDLDGTVEAVRAAGGTVVADPYAFPGGRRFEFQDPSGNRLGVFSEK